MGTLLVGLNVQTKNFSVTKGRDKHIVKNNKTTLEYLVNQDILLGSAVKYHLPYLNF